ncbi:hypothetical protein [Algoriphagus mannitolivorans]|uniref:hypothetical protein n=1 Tax=Algoriphagus mannitolivorans TaxID=226504 RepID=UPI0004004608|nr:hypothetical protein [Algoriphagus mannitolivorans]
MKNQLKNFLLLVCMISAVQFAQAQDYALNPEVQNQMKSLAFLEGHWKGSGWMMGQDRQRMTFQQEEIIEFKLSGTLLEIEGIGKSDGQVVHHALAVIQPKGKDGEYEFSSYLQSGLSGKYPATFKDGKFIWRPTELVRYIIQLNDQGQWHEIGEYNAGDQWFQFMEMTLDKVK